MTTTKNVITNYNSVEFIKANIYRSQDGSSAYMHSQDIVRHLETHVERDEAWMEGIEMANGILAKEGFGSCVTTDNGDSETANWDKL